MPPNKSQALETLIAMAPTSVPKSAIANELRYFGVSLLSAFITLAFLLLCLLTFVKEAFIEHGSLRNTFKWLIISKGPEILGFLSRI
jgi:hypothetical protein